MFTVLSTGIMQIFEILENDILDDYERFKKSIFFDKIYKLALSLELKSRYGNTI
jgi:hypothetical protein